MILQIFKLEVKNGGPNNSDFLENWFPPEISSPLFDLKKLQKPEEGTSESSRMHYNLMTDEEFGSLELLKLK